MWQSFDQRKFPRLKVGCDVSLEDKNNRSFFSSETENIGPGGVCIYLNKSIPPYSPVNVKLKIRDQSSDELECTGKVVWCIQNKTLNQPVSRYDIGIEFQNISAEDRERIRRFILARNV
ncbi:MAG: PilZ domain-containing protein [Candidatus Omnitrophica bacterium]|nr:PilZ domain-containing protein [Candidatus Omnitrophota bacterium]